MPPDAARPLRDRPAWRPLLLLLVGLLVVDGLLVGAHLAHLRGIAEFSGWRWDANADAGWAEVWRGVQLLVAAGYLIRLMEHVPRAPVLGAWAATLVVVVLDDLLRFHEDLGAWFVGRLGLQPVLGVRAQDLGELLAWGVLALVLGGALLATYAASSARARRAALLVGAATAVIVVFAVGLDMLAIGLAEGQSERAYRWTAVLEVGGEMAGAGLVLVTVLWLWRGRPDRTASRPTSERVSPHAAPVP